MKKITVSYGDGIGPEIMSSTLRILNEAGAKLDIEEVEVGEKVFLRGNTSGIEPELWDSLRRTKVFLKAPITTPQGKGFKSINVTARKMLGLYANVRPCNAYAPFIDTKHPNINCVIIRENEEDLYGGIEHRQTNDVTQCLKLITRSGCQKIVKYAFEYARQYKRKKVTCLTKDNIMKITDGLFHTVFNEIGEEYPDIQKEHMIIDIGTAKIADSPEIFDVIVTPNLYGDIISDVAAQISGSVGLAGSKNIGTNCSMFEAVHGSAPDIAGMDIANPSGLLMSAVMMLIHLDEYEIAENIHNAWLTTIEEGIHTADIYNEKISTKKVGTKEFTENVIQRFGRKPNTLQPISYVNMIKKELNLSSYSIKPTNKELLGVDVFFDWSGGTPDDLALKLNEYNKTSLTLTMISNRGTKVWPDAHPDTFCVDHWRCRFMNKDKNIIKHEDIVSLLDNMSKNGLDFIKIENLYSFDGEKGFSLGQGE
jgi:isocitrate dehydrogenase